MKSLINFLVIEALIVSVVCLIILKCQLNDAERYIERLESDFLEYIDTTSGTDEFSNYYNWK